MRNAARITALVILSADLALGTWLCMMKDAGRLDIPWWLATLPFTWPLLLVCSMLLTVILLGLAVLLMVPRDRRNEMDSGMGDIWD